ncbi:MAG: glycoside hydrolase family 32 protein [Phycisphaerae bacterium]|jgi:beta-fructofuranosidase|nr:glycoside hydrolase family 32 protein [Phycisphaerae bacterium]
MKTRITCIIALLLSIGSLAAKSPAQSAKQMIADTRAMREKLLSDPHRPGYHFVSPEGRCGPFDPNAAIFWKGRYHLMYIIQTAKGHSWGHVSSSDLVHWRQHKPSLEPDQGDKGIFSGGIFLDKKGVPTITYWGLGHRKSRGICLATSTDKNLDNWTKNPNNPVIPSTGFGYAAHNVGKAGESIYGTADPSAIWIKGGKYYVLTGNLLVLNEFGRKRKQAKHLGDTLYLLSSDDMITWKYMHQFYKSDRKWTRADEDNMCPEFFPLPSSPEGGPDSGRHMILCISHNLGCRYYIGKYKNDRFIPELHERMTWVDQRLFAPETFADAKGRRIMWAWLFEGRSHKTRDKYGWSGTMSLPRVLWLGKDNTLRMRPAKELASLRYNAKKLADQTVKADTEIPLKGISGNSFEISLTMSGGAKQFGVKVCCSPDGKEQTLIYYDAADKKLKVDTRKSSLGEVAKIKNIEAAPFELKAGEPLKLRIFVDKAVVEVFANDRQAIARAIYPSDKKSTAVKLFAKGGPIKASNIQAWDMMPSNPH